MQTRTRSAFTTIHSEGAILPPDLLQRIAEGSPRAGGLDGLRPEEDYHLARGERLNEAINRSWNRLLGAWAAFRGQAERLGAGDPGTTLTRERWLLPLFQELGYGRLATARAVELDGKSYAVSHAWAAVPIHLAGFRVSLDTRTAGVAGAARSSPHGLVQELLNRSDERLWGFVANGLRLRILRDNASLTRQAYVEFDLEAMMDGEAYSDFVLLWLLCHQSRVEAEKPEDCWLERWSKTAQEQGTRALDQLRGGVTQAIEQLGAGFLAHAANRPLKERLRTGDLDKQEYYRQVLRLVYRLLFLFVAEDRDLLLDPAAPPEARERYSRYYSTARLRHLAERRIGDRHADLYQALRLVLVRLGSEGGCPELGLPALGSFLFSNASTPDLDGCAIANRDLLEAVRALAFMTDHRARRAVDYKNLNVEEMGSVYESLLEMHPILDSGAGSFQLSTAAGNEQKTTGSYYTPQSLVACLLDSALDPVLDQAAKQPDPEAAILNLKVCDPACGSGHFLIAAARRIAKRLAGVRTGDDEPSPEAVRHELRRVIGRCLYGVDMNPMAVELCKVALWMEALEPGRPLSFLDHHIQLGNSLLGTTPALMAGGIPDAAFEPIEGDDKAVCSEFKKRNKQQREGQRSLFDHALQPWDRLGDLAAGMALLEEIGDETIAGVRGKEEWYAEQVRSSGYRFGRLLADAWCAAFVWKKTKDFDYPITEEVFRAIERNPFNLAGWMQAEIERLSGQYRFFHWHLAFPDVFRAPGVDGKPHQRRPALGMPGEPDQSQAGWIGGFDAVLGNPPWERIKIQEKEWFATRRPDIAAAPNADRRRRMIRALAEEDPALFNAFAEDKRGAEGESHLVRDSGRFPLCGRGDVNTYSIFAETNRLILGATGRAGFIVPSGIATDDTTKFFFQDLTESGALASFYEFENEGFFSAGQGHMVRFALTTLAGSQGRASAADFVFQGKAIGELKDQGRHFALTAADIALRNPNTRTCPIFRSHRDAELTKAIYRRVPVLIREGPPEENPWGIRFLAMFHMSNDSGLFSTREQLEADGWRLDGNAFRRGSHRCLPLYEAKMLYQFNHRHGDYGLLRAGQRSHVLPPTPDELIADPAYLVMPDYWVPEAEVKARLAGHWHYGWLLGWRDVTDARASARTVIVTVLPGVGVGHKFPLMMPRNVRPHGIADLQANLDSFALDYTARQKIGGISLTYFYLKQLPVLPPEAYDHPCRWSPDERLAGWIAARVLELTYTAWDLQAFAQDLGYDGPPFVWDVERRFLLRSELDAAFFHLYGVERDDVDYIMEQFPIVRRNDVKRLGEYRTKRVILEIYDAMAAAMAPFDKALLSEAEGLRMSGGTPYETRLDPPPADPRAAHPADSDGRTLRRVAEGPQAYEPGDEPRSAADAGWRAEQGLP